MSAAAAAIVGAFAVEGPARKIAPHAGGHIHESFLVTAGERRCLLQRMNERVFPAPERVMENIAAVSAHLARRGQRTLEIVPARDGTSLACDDAGGRWRMFAFIEGAVTRERARDAGEAGSAARAFGAFQHALADYDGPALHETIPGFHDTEQRVAALDRARHADTHHRVAGAAAPLAFVDRHRARLAPFFAGARARGEAAMRIAHHDAKIANVLFDARTDAAICVVDLDTAMPGLSLYDLGDLVRSMVSPAAEDEVDAARVVAEPARFEAIVRGYLDGTGELLTANERTLLPAAAEAMVFEQGVRFLADHLEGDRYYRIERSAQNLDRCRTQFALLDSLMQQGDAFRRMVERL